MIKYKERKMLSPEEFRQYGNSHEEYLEYLKENYMAETYWAKQPKWQLEEASRNGLRACLLSAIFNALYIALSFKEHDFINNAVGSYFVILLMFFLLSTVAFFIMKFINPYDDFVQQRKKKKRLILISAIVGAAIVALLPHMA